MNNKDMIEIAELLNDVTDVIAKRLNKIDDRLLIIEEKLKQLEKGETK